MAAMAIAGHVSSSHCGFLIGEPTEQGLLLYSSSSPSSKLSFCLPRSPCSIARCLPPPPPPHASTLPPPPSPPPSPPPPLSTVKQHLCSVPARRMTTITHRGERRRCCSRSSSSSVLPCPRLWRSTTSTSHPSSSSSSSSSSSFSSSCSSLFIFPRRQRRYSLSSSPSPPPLSSPPPFSSSSSSSSGPGEIVADLSSICSLPSFPVDMAKQHTLECRVSTSLRTTRVTTQRNSCPPSPKSSESTSTSTSLLRSQAGKSTDVLRCRRVVSQQGIRTNAFPSSSPPLSSSPSSFPLDMDSNDKNNPPPPPPPSPAPPPPSSSSSSIDGGGFVGGPAANSFSSSTEEFLANLTNPFEIKTTEELFQKVAEEGPPPPIPNFGYSQQYVDVDADDLSSSSSDAKAPHPIPDLKPNSIPKAFYDIAFDRLVQFNSGVEFLKDPESGWGVYASQDFPFSDEPRVLMSIPIEVMLSCCTDLPWRFNPDIVPMGHPIFDIINSSDPSGDWDLRLASLLLLGMDQGDCFWSRYSKFLPTTKELTSLLLASREELAEFQDDSVVEFAIAQQERAEALHAKYWPADSALKLKRLCPTPLRFKWAMGIATSRQIRLKLLLGPLELPSNLLSPYSDMLNHSFHPNCTYRWDKNERLLEVVLYGGQEVRAGTQFTVDYGLEESNEEYVRRYGFTMGENPFSWVKFSGENRVHEESFLSAFKVCRLENEYYYAGGGGSGGGDATGEDGEGGEEVEEEEEDEFVDGTMMAVARMLPTWSNGDWPAMPSEERAAARRLQREAADLLSRFPTTLKEDKRIWEKEAPTQSPLWKAALRFRMDRKNLLHKTIEALQRYSTKILF